MQDTFERQKIKAVVFDWAGTIFDFGSHAPMGAFVKLFAAEGIQISIADARAPMGLPKWHHIEALLQFDHVKDQWLTQHKKTYTINDVNRLYTNFTPINILAVKEHAQFIPGFLEVVAGLRSKNIAIGTTTGYNREIMDSVLSLAKAQGFVPDNLICGDDLPLSRPSPMGMYKTFLDLCIWPSRSVIKVDDTVPGLLEGFHSNCWTVGVIASGNEAGLTLHEWQDLPEPEKVVLRQHVALRLAPGKPDFLIDTVADLPQVLQQIEGN